MDNNQKYYYAAFISYRHTERDIPIAASLHRQLETFTFPSRAIRKAAGQKKFGRIFRDKDELPLAGDLPQTLQTALAQSKWFICLLCDDYFQSPYCVSELRYFVSMHGVSRVIPIITAGKAPEVFPKFWYALTDLARPFDEKGMPFEPLAMEIAADDPAQRLKNLKNEKLRLFAQMLNVNYDALYRRFHRRKVRIVIAVSAAIIAIASAFAVGAVYSAMQIERQRVIAVTNEIQLLIQRSMSDSDSSNNLEAMQKALEAYARYTELYPLGDEATQGQIYRALSAAAYSQPYQLVQKIHNDNRLLSGMSYSPDDKYILCTSGGGTTLIDASDGSILSVKAHAGEVGFTQFSPDGKYYLAAAEWTNRVEIFETENPADAVASYVVESELAWALRGAGFLPGGSVLLSLEDALLIWDFQKDTAEKISDKDTFQGTLITSGAVISPDGKLAVCTLDFLSETLPVIDITSGKRLTYQMPVMLGGYVFAFSPDGSRLAGAFVGTIVIWDTTTREVLRIIETESHDVSGLVFSPDGKTLAATALENIMIFRADSGKLLHTFGAVDLRAGYTGFGAAFTSDSKNIVIWGNTAQVYDLARGKLISDFGGQMGVSAALSHDGRYIALSTWEGDAGIYSTSASATAFTEPKAEKELYSYPQQFEVSMQPGLLYRTHHYDQSIYPFVLEVMTNSPSGRYTTLTYPDGYVEIWDLSREDGQSSYLLREHIGMIKQTSMTDQFLLTAGYDGRIMVFDLEKGETRHFFSVGERIPRFEISKNGDMIIALTESLARAHVYELYSGNRIYTLEAETGDLIADIGFAPDGSAAVIVQESGREVSGAIFQDFDTLLDRALALTAH